MIVKSIRWRLQLWHGLILLVVLTGFGYTAYQVARDNQLRRIDQELEHQLMSAVRPELPDRPPREPGPREQMPREPAPGDQFAPGDRRREPPGLRRDPAVFRARMRESLQQAVSSAGAQTNSFYFVLWQEDGLAAVRSAGAPASVPEPDRPEPREPGPPQDNSFRPSPRARLDLPGPFMLRTRGEFREAYRFMPFGDCLLVGHFMLPELAAMHRLALWLVAAGSAVLVLGLAGGWWVASRAIQPIAAISAAAGKIAAGDLSQRINAADTESELGRLAGVLNSTFARLEAAFAHQARFTSDASHELRTPVAVILSQTQSALARERSAAEYREALQACQRAAQRMRKLTESLLELARLDAGQEPLKRERLDLARVVRDSVELVRPLAAERGIELRCELPITECLGDAEWLGQVAVNLLTNAIRFNRDQGEVRVSTRAEKASAFLTVSDTGPGISPADQPHLFERFYRADKARSRAQGSNGLGLAICKAIVDAHGGSIEVSSQPGAGSIFVVRLPTV